MRDGAEFWGDRLLREMRCTRQRAQLAAMRTLEDAVRDAERRALATPQPSPCPCGSWIHHVGCIADGVDVFRGLGWVAR